MRRGDVYDASLDPVQGSEQAGTRPVIIVSRDAINNASGVVLGVPCTTLRPGRRVYPSQAAIKAPEGGLDRDSVAMCEQMRVLDKSRLGRHRGALGPLSMRRVERAILVALDMDTP